MSGVVLLRRRETVADVVVDVGLLAQAANGLDREPEVGGDLGLGQITTAGNSDDVTQKLRRERLGRGDILPARTHRA